MVPNNPTIPQTNFPDNPKNRWRNWKGILNAGDEVFIFTKSIQSYVHFIFKTRGLKDGFPEEEAIEISSDTLQMTMDSIKNYLMNRTEEERTIKKSLDDFIFSFLWISYNHIRYKHFHKEDNLVFNDEFIHAQVSSINLLGEVIQSEILHHVLNCFSRLKEKDRKVMEAYYLDGYSLKKIAKLFHLEQYDVVNSYNKGRRETRNCLTNKGFREYLHEQ